MASNKNGDKKVLLHDDSDTESDSEYDDGGGKNASKKSTVVNNSQPLVNPNDNKLKLTNDGDDDDDESKSDDGAYLDDGKPKSTNASTSAAKHVAVKKLVDVDDYSDDNEDDDDDGGNAYVLQKASEQVHAVDVQHDDVSDDEPIASTSTGRSTARNNNNAAANGNNGEPTFFVRSRTAAVNEAAMLDNKNIYESLDYDVCENELFLADEKLRNNSRFFKRKDILRWFIFIQIGVFTALIACGIDLAIEALTNVKFQFLKNSVDETTMKSADGVSNVVIPFLYWMLLNAVPVAVGAAMVTYIEPITAGSGIPQVKCYLNGVKVPRIVRIKTLAVKAIGVITSVVGGLAGGKEGPMIHAGAVVAAGISQGKSTTFVKDFQVFKAFRDDHEKRDFVLGGAAAGVAAAFGAPIGGMLFSLEEAASFWNQNLIWRTLVASIISSFTLNIILSIYHGLSSFQFNGLFNLGKFDPPLTFEYFELPIFMILGVTGGLFGALWNSMNTKINCFRRRCIRYKCMNVVEAILIAIMSATVASVMIIFINDCRPLGNDPTNFPLQLFCPDNEYNAVAALWFQTPEATVKSLFHDPPGSHQILTLALFALVYFLLACLTFGLNVSVGVFIPTALIGAAWGRLVAMILFYTFPNASFLNPGKYALIGAAANLGGVLRMTISLSVILMETTGVETSFFFPLIVTLITAKWMGDYFNEGIYDTQIEINHVPLLPWEVPKQYLGLKTTHIMSTPVVCIKIHDTARYIYDILHSCNHNGFPVVDDVQGNARHRGRVCGIILRSQLIVILLKCLYREKRRFWQKETTIQTFRDVYPRYPSIESVTLHEDKVAYTVDLNIFMNPSVVRVSEFDSVPKTFNKFRALGLRHMVVVDHENRVVGIITRKDFLYK